MLRRQLQFSETNRSYSLNISQTTDIDKINSYVKCNVASLNSSGLSYVQFNKMVFNAGLSIINNYSAFLSIQAVLFLKEWKIFNYVDDNIRFDIYLTNILKDIPNLYNDYNLNNDDLKYTILTYGSGILSTDIIYNDSVNNIADTPDEPMRIYTQAGNVLCQILEHSYWHNLNSHPEYKCYTLQPSFGILLNYSRPIFQLKKKFKQTLSIFKHLQKTKEGGVNMLRKTLDMCYNSQKTLFTFSRRGATSDSSNFITNYVEIPSGTYFASYGLAEPSDVLYAITRVFGIINIINNTTIHFSIRFGLVLKNPIDINQYADHRVSFKVNLSNVFTSLKSKITQYYDVSDDIWTSNIYKTISSTYPSCTGEFLFKHRTTTSVPDSPAESFEVTIDGNGIIITTGDINVLRMFKISDSEMTNNHYLYGVQWLNLSVVLSWNTPMFKVKKNLNLLSVKHLLNNFNYKEVA